MTPAALAALLRDHPAAAGAQLVVLHGSRARGDAGPHSDWDFGVLGPAVDLPALGIALVDALATERIDVADLATASALLRFRAARDGIGLLERPAGAFRAFQLDAVLFWCDAGPVIRAAQADVLAAL